MKFAIITSASHGQDNSKYFSYAPYVNEINIWIKYVDEVIILAPLDLTDNSNISEFYYHNKIKFIVTNAFNIKNFISILNTIIGLPKIIFQIFKVFRYSDHIHFRCPSNIGLLACFVQIFFPNKIKTTKYAGNWDPNAKNPLSYKFQKWILSNTFLTKNMQVLVYGQWQNQSNNIKPFFTATYRESDKIELKSRNFETKINFLFVGMLTKGKNPLYAIKIVEKLLVNHQNIKLSIYGDGLEKLSLERYIKTNNLENFVSLKGNQNLETLKLAYQESHFLILPSESEGWPKAVAEAMFWACLPISTSVSCVANMLENGKRGVLINMNLINDVQEIENLLNNEKLYLQKAKHALKWSRNYTLDLFEQEIRLLLRQ